VPPPSIRGFSRSARALHISPSAISDQISDLEQEIGVRLLVRGRQKMRVTLQGEVFLSEARKVLAAADHPVETVRRSARGEIGELNIALGHACKFFSSHWIGDLYPVVRHKYFRL
jgi:DNA-binding transcriptional LysR family regulator